MTQYLRSKFGVINLLWIISLCFLFQSCYVTRAYKNRNFRLTDLDKLESVALLPAEKPFEFAYTLSGQKAFTDFLDSNLENTNTYSFLVIKNDSIVYEKYFDDVTETTKLPSFSVAKSFIGTLVQMAIEDGYIKSLQEPITNYLGFLKENDNRFQNITIQHVMNMASGIKNSEDYSNPFGDVLHLGFTKNLNNQLKKLKIETTPGNFDYKSVNTQILAAIIEVSTQQKVQDYFVKKIWYPLGMQYEATWNIDSKKHQLVRAFCCINAATKDFAKLGKLYLQQGNYNGKQLISEQYITNSTNSDSMQQNGGYKNQWWAGTPFVYFKDSLAAINFITITPKTTFNKRILYKDVTYYSVKDELAPYYAEGILGQFIYINPRTQTIIVRMGHYWNSKRYNSELSLITASDNYLTRLLSNTNTNNN